MIAVIGSTSQIWDIGSTNGTTVNGRRIEEPTDLAPDDVIGLGDACLVLELVEELGDDELERQFDHGQGLQREGKEREALAHFERVVESGHRHLAARAAHAAGRICEHLGLETRAVEHYRGAIGEGESEIAALAACDLGKLLARRGDFSQAADAFDYAIRFGDDKTRAEAIRERSDALPGFDNS